MFILEDNHLGEVNRAVTDLKAYNPDKDLGDILSWRVFQHPTSGGDIPDEITSTNEGDYTLISDFSYIPPKNFFGLDSFTLVADEGDRSTEVVIEVHVKEVQDPPLFNTPGPLVFDAQKGTVFEKTIFANDPDKQKLVFRLLYPSGSNKWLSVQSTSSNINQSSITIGGQIPLSGGSGSYTLVASDPTGRFTILNIEVQAN